MLAHRLGERTRRGAAVAAMAAASLRGHQFERALNESRRAIALGEAVASEEIVAAGRYTTGLVNCVTGHLAEARRHLEQAGALGSSGSSAFYQTQSSAVLGLIENWRGDYAAATTKLRKGVAFARDHNHPFALLQDLFYLGLPLAGQGRYDEALATFTEGLELAVKLGDEIFRNRFLNCRGWVLADSGDLKQAIEFNRRGVGVPQERGDPETIANCKLNLVDLHLVQREFGLARDLLESVHRLAQKPSTSDWLKWRYSQHLFAALGRPGWRPTIPPGPRGSAIDASSSRRARARRNTWCAAGACGAQWQLRLQWEEAEEALKRARGLARRIGNPTQLWQTDLALGRLQRATGRADPARRSFAAARGVIDAIGRGLRTPELKAGFERSPVFLKIYEQIAAV